MRLFKVYVCILLSLFCAVPLYAEDSLNRLADVAVESVDGKLLVRLSSAQPVGYRYTVYDSIDPVRVVVDFPRMELGEIKTPVVVDQGGIQEIRFSTFELSLGTLVRAEILLDHQTAYKVDFTDKAMTLAFEQTEPVKVAVDTTSATAKAAADKAAAEKIAADKAAADKAAAVKAAADKAAAVKAAAVKAAADKAAADKAAADKAAADKAAADKAVADKAAADKATKVSSAAVTVGKNQVDITTSAGFSRLKYFELETPKRLVVDLFGVELADRIMKYDLAEGFTQLRVGPYADKLRFVFDTEKGLVPEYKVLSADNSVQVSWVAAKNGIAAKVNAASAPTTPVAVSALPVPITQPSVAAVTKIDFSSHAGTSVYRIEVDGPISLVEPVQDGTIVKFGLKNTTIPRALSRVYASFAFPTAVQSVTPYQVIEGQTAETRFVVQLKGLQPYTLVQESGAVLLKVEDGTYAVADPVRDEERILPVAAPAPRPASATAETSPLAPVDVLAPDAQANALASNPIVARRNDMAQSFSGEKISLVFDNAEVRNILQLIAEVSNLNIIASDEIKGNVTLRLIDVPWDQALTLVLDITNLGMIREGNVVRVLPKDTIRSMREAELAADRAQEKLEPVQTEVISVNYADLTAVVGPTQKLLSDRGSMTEDARNKLVIVTDIPSRIEKVRELVKILDTPERQVMIEARIVEVNSNFSRDLGVNWGINFANPGEKMGAGSLGIGGDFLVGLPSGPGSAATEAGLGAGFTYGRIGIDQTILDLRLSALESNGNAKVISTPRVTTLNGEEATISQGTTIPYQTSGADGPKTEFVNANLELKVKPVINPDGSVILEILATNDTPSITAGASAPSIDTKKAETKVLVMDGETTVIGGIFIDTKQVSDSGVPYLGKLPLLGQLFRSDKTVQTKAELMIFITPRILSNN